MREDEPPAIPEDDHRRHRGRRPRRARGGVRRSRVRPRDPRRDGGRRHRRPRLRGRRRAERRRHRRRGIDRRRAGPPRPRRHRPARVRPGSSTSTPIPTAPSSPTRPRTAACARASPPSWPGTAAPRRRRWPASGSRIARRSSLEDGVDPDWIVGRVLPRAAGAHRHLHQPGPAARPGHVAGERDRQRGSRPHRRGDGRRPARASSRGWTRARSASPPASSTPRGATRRPTRSWPWPAWSRATAACTPPTSATRRRRCWRRSTRPSPSAGGRARGCRSRT